jgi:hypothetical protein
MLNLKFHLSKLVLFVKNKMAEASFSARVKFSFAHSPLAVMAFLFLKEGLKRFFPGIGCAIAFRHNKSFPGRPAERAGTRRRAGFPGSSQKNGGHCAKMLNDQARRTIERHDEEFYPAVCPPGACSSIASLPL